MEWRLGKSASHTRCMEDDSSRYRQKRCALRLVGCTGAATTKDHIIPKSRGGKRLHNNTRPACEPCNQRKGNRLDEELRAEDFRIGDPRRDALVTLSRLAV